MTLYAIALVHEEDGAYGVSFPDFPGCISGGSSLEEAVSHGASALAAHVERTVPEGRLPKLRSIGELKEDPAFVRDANGAVVVAVALEPRRPRMVQVELTLEESLLERADRAAAAQGTSRAVLVTEALRSYLTGR